MTNFITTEKLKNNFNAIKKQENENRVDIPAR